MAQVDEAPEMFMPAVLYREWARRFLVTDQPGLAIDYYRKAMSYGQEQLLWSLLGLSDALKRSGQYAQAAEVAEECMRQDAGPSLIRAAHTRIDAFYDTGEFGKSLAVAHDANRRYRDFGDLIQLGNETLENCIGRNVSPTIMLDILPWIRELKVLAAKLHEESLLEEDEFAGLGETTGFRVNEPMARFRKHLRDCDDQLAALYFGRMAEDKAFVARLIEHPGLPSANQEGSQELKKVAEHCSERIQVQQEVLRTRKPLYYFQSLVKKRTPGVKVWYVREHQVRKCLARNEAIRILRELHRARLRRDYPTFFKLVERAKEKFESYPRSVCPDKQRYLGALYKIVARAYLDPRNLTSIKGEEQKEVYLKRLLGLQSSKLPREEDLAWTTTYNPKKMFQLHRERLALAQEPEEIVWIFHELAKLFIEVNRLDLGRFYAKKTHDLSIAHKFDVWKLNATHILIRIELAQSNRNEAKEAAQLALAEALELDADFVVDFYKRAINLIDRLDFGRETMTSGIATRQNLIRSLMPESMKRKMNQLLDSINSVEAKRRFSVMPGCAPSDEGALTGKRRTIQAKEFVHYDKVVRDELLKNYAPSDKVLGRLDLTQFD